MIAKGPSLTAEGDGSDSGSPLTELVLSHVEERPVRMFVTVV
jgi:hypothetical protein